MRFHAFLLLTMFVAAAARAESVAPEGTGTWLDLVDKGQYAESWSRTGSYFQAQVTQDAWVTRIGPVRAPLGAVKSRNLRSVDYIKSLPGAPDGDYAIVKYDTEFANKSQSTETVAMVRERGEWRLVGYFIK